MPHVTSRANHLTCAAGLALFCALAGNCQKSDGGSLETAVSRLMADKSGAVVVLDVATGQVLADDNYKLAAQRVAAPGSTVKPFVLIELLQSGKLDPGQQVYCRRTLTIAGKRMDCSHSAAVRSINATDAIAYSCNTYFATMAARLNPAELVQVYERAGFTAPTHIAPDEQTGRVARAPDVLHLQLQALGDWGVEITPLELVAAYRNLAIEKRDGSAPQSVAPVFDGMERSVKYGMAHAAWSAGISAAGKTGTAANIRSAQTHGFFAGYAPADKPEIVLMVYLEQGRGSDAAAIASQIFSAYAQANPKRGQ